MENEIKRYIQSLYNNDQILLAQLEEYAKVYRVPIMEKDGIEILKQLIRISKPQRILEIGTAIGYSTIQMALSDEQSVITTIEIDEERYEEAKKNIHLAGLEHRIQVKLADAMDYLDNLDSSSTFDFVFIDAAKGKYQTYFEKIDPYVSSGGLIVIDNVIFKGFVAKETDENQRLLKLGKKINIFNQWLMKNEDYHTVIIESGDGIAVARKK